MEAWHTHTGHNIISTNILSTITYHTPTIPHMEYPPTMWMTHTHTHTHARTHTHDEWTMNPTCPIRRRRCILPTCRWPQCEWCTHTHTHTHTRDGCILPTCHGFLPMPQDTIMNANECAISNAPKYDYPQHLKYWNVKRHGAVRVLHRIWLSCLGCGWGQIDHRWK